MKHINIFLEHSSYEEEKATLANSNVTYCDDLMHIHFNKIPFEDLYLTFRIKSSGTISWRNKNRYLPLSISYKLNDGEWTSIMSSTGGTSFNVNVDDVVLLKANINCYYNYYFSGTASFDISGNIMSLVYEDNFKNNNTLSLTNTFRLLFRGNVISAENLILPANNLISSCYYGMFLNTSITIPPKLPAINLAQGCYYSMFEGCSNLTIAPELPAKVMLADCYSNMFKGCTSLTKAPKLNAKQLDVRCYLLMFNGCTNLSSPIELPSLYIPHGAYAEMLAGTNVSYIKCMAVLIGHDSTLNWVENLQSQSGTFVKNTAASFWEFNDSGIPQGFDVINVGEPAILRMWIDDFPEDYKDYQEGDRESLMEAEVNAPLDYNCDEYVYCGNTIQYGNNTYYLWEYSGNDYVSVIEYLLTDTIDYDTLYDQSLENDIQNTTVSLLGKLNSDFETYRSQMQSYYIVKVERSLIAYVDDFPLNKFNNDPTAIENAKAQCDYANATAYAYSGNSLIYNGQIMYLWDCISSGICSNDAVYLATTTVNPDELYNQSLEYDVTSTFTSCIGLLKDDGEFYMFLDVESDNARYLVRVEVL